MSDARLALAVVEALDDRALELLAEKLAPLRAAGGAPDPGPVAFTVATLAVELGLTERQVRGMIHRGEIPAAKRGCGYVIARNAVEAWAAPDEGGLEGHALGPAGRDATPLASARGRAHRPVMAAALARLDTGR